MLQTTCLSLSRVRINRYSRNLLILSLHWTFISYHSLPHFSILVVSLDCVQFHIYVFVLIPSTISSCFELFCQSVIKTFIGNIVFSWELMFLPCYISNTNGKVCCLYWGCFMFLANHLSNLLHLFELTSKMLQFRWFRLYRKTFDKDLWLNSLWNANWDVTNIDFLNLYYYSHNLVTSIYFFGLIGALKNIQIENKLSWLHWI